jgi:hypothetical protein
MNADRAAVLCATILLAAATLAAGWVAGGVQRQRRDLELVVSSDGVEGVPPHVAIATAALGTFRGLAVDILWARADHLQSEGEYFEAQTLSQWITALQPRFQKVWAFQAWNLAYNIAAATQVPAERWGWVRRGISLLRDQGIPLNPKAPQLHMELGWIYHNKIAGRSDKEHWYYKARLARDMQEVLGDLTGGRTTEQAVELFRRIADAPDTLSDLLRTSPRVQDAIDLLAEHDAKPDEDFLRMLGTALMYARSFDAKLAGGDTLPEGVNRGLLAALRGNRERAEPLFDQLVPHLQKRVLVDRYRMDPAKMLALMERYGPLDWRHAESHGIYWTEEGIEIGRTLKRREGTNELLIVRSRLHMLSDLMRTGRVDYDPATNRVDLLPDPRFAKSYEQSLEEALALINSEAGVSAGEFGRAEETDLLDGYETFLNLAVILEFLYGDKAAAAEYFVKLRLLVERLGKADQPLYSDTMETFVGMRIGEVLAIDVSNLRQFLDAMLRRAMMEGLAKGNLEVFNRYLGVAFRAYDRRYSASDPQAKFVLEESKLLPFPKLVENSFQSVMRQDSLPVMLRARIWAWAPDKLRTASYEPLAETLRGQAEAAGLDPDRAFPRPAGEEKPGDAGKNPKPDDPAAKTEP